MLIYVVCLSFFGVSRFSSKDLWFGWCAVHRRQLNQQNLDRRRLCGILVSKHISHCDPLRTLTDEIPKPTTPTNINALHLTASDCIWHLWSLWSLWSSECSECDLEKWHQGRTWRPVSILERRAEDLLTGRPVLEDILHNIHPRPPDISRRVAGSSSGNVSWT